MGDIVNLNKFRKEREREAEKRAARDNRARFGRSGADKAADRSARDKADASFDGKKRETPEGDSTPDAPAPKAR